MHRSDTSMELNKCCIVWIWGICEMYGTVKKKLSNYLIVMLLTMRIVQTDGLLKW